MIFAAAFSCHPVARQSVLIAHVVSHTHWDREWYQPLVRFRQRLVALIDELLDDPPAPGESFLLDGQAIILEDYLAVRPDREPELRELLQSRRLEAGPWYVLADELIPGGEALVRNLLMGQRVLRRCGATSPPVLYCPDSFGHPAALPLLAAGFGLALIIVWRGFGGRQWPRADTVLWRAPDGQRVATYHYPPSGYEYGSDLPTDEPTARTRWARMRETYLTRSVTGVVLLPNGADHHARQRDLASAIGALTTVARATGDRVVPGSLRGFAEQLLARAREKELPRIEGELRDSYGYTWTLQGTFASRADQKRRNARVERALVRDAEPWAALARLRGMHSRLPLLVAAWRTLLQGHPHDTLCGCSIDVVAEAMNHRLEDALTQAIGVRDDAIADLAGFDADAARMAKARWKPLIVVRNRAPRSRSGVAIVEFEQAIADVAVGPGSAPSGPSATPALPGTPSLGPEIPVQVLARSTRYGRLEAPRHYPDNDLIAVSRAAIWIEDVAGYGLAALPFAADQATPAAPPHQVRSGQTWLDNGIVRLAVRDDGMLLVEDRGSGRRIDDVLVIEDRVDVGDLYTPAIRGQAATVDFIGAALRHQGPLLGEIQLRWRLRAAKPTSRSSELTIGARLVADSPLVRFEVRGVNRHGDHRVRVAIRTGVENGSIWADAAFGPVQRVPLDIPPEDRRDEIPPATAPLHRYISIFSAGRGATLFSDGLAEYEATEDGEVFVTLVRAVGELSRNDIPERPGHAGWPSPTPAAQCLGSFGARLALLLHGARSPTTIDAIERTADDFLLPLEGRTLRFALDLPPQQIGIELRGRGLAFSTLKESEDGEWTVARCVNLLDQPVDGEWRVGKPIRRACLARLDETALDDIAARGTVIPFRAAPRAVVTIVFN